MNRKFVRAGLAVASLLVAAVALRVALAGFEWEPFLASLPLLDWRWLSLAVVFDFLSYGLQGVRWSYLLEGSRILLTTRAIYAGLFINEVVPMRPGEFVRAWFASRDLKTGMLLVLPSIVCERLMDGVWLALALLASMAVAPLTQGLQLAIWCLVAAVSLAGLVRWYLGTRGGTFVQSVVEGFRNWRAFVLSGAFLIAQGLAFWSVMRASHLRVGLVAAFVVMVVVRIGTLIPGAPANLGTHQYATVLGLSLYGVPRNEAVGFSLVVFSVLTLPLLLMGFMACVNGGLTWGRLRDLRLEAAG